MRYDTLKKRLENYTDKQFIEYVKRCWCKSNKQVLLDMLEDLELQYDSKESMVNLISKYRNEIKEYVLEAYYNA